MNTTLLRLGAKLFVILMLIIIGVQVFKTLSVVTEKYNNRQIERLGIITGNQGE